MRVGWVHSNVSVSKHHTSLQHSLSSHPPNTHAIPSTSVTVCARIFCSVICTCRGVCGGCCEEGYSVDGVEGVVGVVVELDGTGLIPNPADTSSTPNPDVVRPIPGFAIFVVGGGSCPDPRDGVEGAVVYPAPLAVLSTAEYGTTVALEEVVIVVDVLPLRLPAFLVVSFSFSLLVGAGGRTGTDRTGNAPHAGALLQYISVGGTE